MVEQPRDVVDRRQHARKLGPTIAGVAVYADVVGDYLAGIALGVAFQSFAIAPMRGLGCVS